jgi:hypothetical protein
MTAATRRLRLAGSILAARLLRRLAPGKSERDARRAVGMPARHPERITRDLAAGQDEWLAELASELWPDDEYTIIVAELWRDGLP